MARPSPPTRDDALARDLANPLTQLRDRVAGLDVLRLAAAPLHSRDVDLFDAVDAMRRFLVR